jgi:hypothetical protein
MIFNRHQIKSILESKCGGKVAAMAKMLEADLMLPATDPNHIDVGNFSLRETAEGCGIDTAQSHIMVESVGAAQFSTIVGTLLSKIVMDAFTAAAKIADQLVTPFPSNQETDKIPGAYLSGDMEDIVEKGKYPHLANINDKYAEIGHGKRGLILDITDEAVRFDQTGLVMKRAADMGELMAIDRETRAINTIQDITGYYAWYPSGSRVALYNDATTAPHTLDNLTTDILADYTDLRALYNLLRLMKDDNGKYIFVQPKILLVPIALEITARRIIVNDVLPGGANNERNPFANMFTILSSPLLDAQSSVIWYLGDFKKQFMEKIVIPMEVRQRSYNDNNDDAWESDIVASYKIRYDSKVGAIDYRYVGKSTGAA